MAISAIIGLLAALIALVIYCEIRTTQRFKRLTSYRIELKNEKTRDDLLDEALEDILQK